MDTLTNIVLPWLDMDTPLPPAASALRTPAQLSGLVAAGGDLSTSRLQEAYSQGIFPWFNHDQPVLWWSPDPRMVLHTAAFRIHRSLKKTLLKFKAGSDGEIRIDSAFDRVIRHCANAPRQGNPGTWIGEDMIHAYQALHRLGLAHSVETWINGELAGGLYCVALGHAVFGESMFSLQTDASKIALAALVAFARHHEVRWIDCQQNTRHLASLGAQEMPRANFIHAVHQASAKPALNWRFQSLYWNSLFPESSLT